MIITGVNLTLYKEIPTLMHLRKKALKNVVGKGEDGGIRHFLLFPHCFLPMQQEFQHLSKA